MKKYYFYLKLMFFAFIMIIFFLLVFIANSIFIFPGNSDKRAIPKKERFLPEYGRDPFLVDKDTVHRFYKTLCSIKYKSNTSTSNKAGIAGQVLVRDYVLDYPLHVITEAKISLLADDYALQRTLKGAYMYSPELLK